MFLQNSIPTVSEQASHYWNQGKHVKCVFLEISTMPVCAFPLLRDILWTPEEKAVIFTSQDVWGYREWQRQVHLLPPAVCPVGRCVCQSLDQILKLKWTKAWNRTVNVEHRDASSRHSMLAASEKDVLSSVSWCDSTWLTLVAKSDAFYVLKKKLESLEFIWGL